MVYPSDEWYKKINMTRQSGVKKYVAIVKTGNNPDGSAHCVKYRLNDLLKFAAFLDKKWTGWRWFNLYNNHGRDKGQQIASFTNKRRPSGKKV